MAITFPDPDVTESFDYTTPNDVTVSYIWDGEKWVNIGTTNNIDKRVSDLEIEVGSIDGRVTALENAPPPVVEGLKTRQTKTVTASGIVGIFEWKAEVDITNYPKSSLLLSVETSRACWVTIYSDKQSRASDVFRSSEIDPSAGEGVLAEVITSDANLKQILTPSTITFNSEDTPVDELYISVRNLEGTLNTSNVSVTLTYLQLEA